MEEQKIFVCMPAKVVTDIVAYLETRPYADVAKLIAEVARSAKDCTAQVHQLYEPAPVVQAPGRNVVMQAESTVEQD